MHVQESLTKTIPKKKKCKKAKWLFEEDLHIAENRREVKGKGKRKKAEFQRIARRDKKAFLRGQSKEIEEKDRMEKIEISSRKSEIPRDAIRDTKRCKDGHNKGQKWYGPNRNRRY